MAQQVFAAGEAPRIVITLVQGDLDVHVWDERSISVETDGTVAGLNQEGTTLTIGDCDDDLLLQVPPDTTIHVTRVEGDAEIEGVRRVELGSVDGDVALQDISGESSVEDDSAAIEITTMGGDLSVENTPMLRVRHSIGGDASLKEVATVEIETVGGDFVVKQASTVLVSTVGGDMVAEDVTAALRCGVVGGDASAHGGPRTDIMLGNTGGDLSVGSAASLEAGNIGGDASIRDVQGDIEIGHTGSDISINGAGGNLRVGSIGGDASLKGVQGGIETVNVGGDVYLQGAFPPDSATRMNVGGDAAVVLPDNANLSIRALVGGDISGKAIIASRSGNMVNLVYGEGQAHLELNVGGDLALRGGSNPRASSSFGDWGGSFGREMGNWGKDFGREMANLGRELGRLGEDLGREIASTFAEAGWSKGGATADEVSRKAREQADKARRKADEAARKASERAARMNIRINDREWRLDPERLRNLEEQARRAAEGGIANAMEAVDRALSNLGVAKPPVPPTPPVSPVSPVAPVPPVPPTPPTSPFSSSPEASTQDEENKGEEAGDASAQPAIDEPTARTREQERVAILRMIAEGRITPEEGDLLLEALG